MRSTAAAVLIAAIVATATAVAATLVPRPIAGGVFEASGVVFVDGGALFVDDSIQDSLFWMALDDAGLQVGAVKPVPLGISIRDMEGITTDGRHVYVVGSQSKKDSPASSGLAKVTLVGASLRVSSVESIRDLKTLLFAALPDVRQAAGNRVDGFNIEGLAWEPRRKRLLLGLRAPVVNGHALVIPLRLKNVEGAFDAANLAVDPGDVMRVALGGAGIRSLELDGADERYSIISGSDSDAERAFELWRWSPGGTPEREPIATPLFSRELKPEGITRVTMGGASYKLIVFDSGRYAALR